MQEEERGAGVADGPDVLAYTLGGKLAAVLVAGGYGSVAVVQAASDDELRAAPGVTEKALKLIRTKVGKER